MKHLSKKAIFIDLDGTIINSIEGIVNGMKYAFDKVGKELPEFDYNTIIGPPIEYSLRRFTDDEQEIKAIIESYREYYSNTGINECKMYDGMRVVLNTLFNRGYNLYLATSKPLLMARKIIKELDIEKLFINVYAPDNDSNMGSKDKVLAVALEDSCEDSKFSLMIGDTEWDKKGAEANNIDFGAALYGFGARETIYCDNNYFNVDNPTEILKYLL